MILSDMARAKHREPKQPDPPSPVEEIIRRNMVRFREAKDLSVTKAAQLSGVPEMNLRRYEGGQTQRIPGEVLIALGPIYGHTVEEFSLADPPPARAPAEQPMFFLKTLPGVEVDQELFEKLQREIEAANAIAAKKRPRK